MLGGWEGERCYVRGVRMPSTSDWNSSLSLLNPRLSSNRRVDRDTDKSRSSLLLTSDTALCCSEGTEARNRGHCQSQDRHTYIHYSPLLYVCMYVQYSTTSQNGSCWSPLTQQGHLPGHSFL